MPHVLLPRKVYLFIFFSALRSRLLPFARLAFGTFAPLVAPARRTFFGQGPNVSIGCLFKLGIGPAKWCPDRLDQLFSTPPCGASRRSGAKAVAVQEHFHGPTPLLRSCDIKDRRRDETRYANAFSPENFWQDWRNPRRVAACQFLWGLFRTTWTSSRSSQSSLHRSELTALSWTRSLNGTVTSLP